MAREANRDLEISCDEAVVRGTSLSDRRRYSETILCALQAGKRRATTFFISFNGGKQALLLRFRSILDTSMKSHGLLALFSVLILFAGTIGGCVAFQSSPAPSDILDKFISSNTIRRPLSSSFTIPEGMDEVPYLQVSGRLKMGDGEMSWHAFDEETSQSFWEAGKAYTTALEADSIIEGTVYISLTDGRRRTANRSTGSLLSGRFGHKKTAEEGFGEFPNCLCFSHRGFQKSSRRAACFPD